MLAAEDAHGLTAECTGAGPVAVDQLMERVQLRDVGRGVVLCQLRQPFERGVERSRVAHKGWIVAGQGRALEHGELGLADG